MAKQLNVDMRFTADTSQASAAIQSLNADLKKIASTPQGLFDDTSIKNASAAALELQRHLQDAVNVNTGKLDLSRFASSLSASGKDLNYFKTNLLAIGEDGQQAFLHLAQSIASAEAPTTRVNKKLMEMGTVLKNTVRWQISSSIIHGFMGAVQQAWGYAQDLNESLNNIRIVTGHNTEQMAEFAKKANDAAKALHTTTTEYTDASLIYYQQGLSDKEVQERTDVTIKLANVSRQSAEDVSDQMTAIWNNFYDGSESLEYYADVITNLGAHTASSSSEIAQGIQKFAAVAHTTGLSYEYATSALATLVATTRESADVVGTSLKTLFARIQGLKLGETLEDGVDLNKYSKALNAVGVSIMDQAGNLRNMDDILDDIGAKWDTLNRTQQTALAQTVAGVRQYNQFVALMDNWDFMKENLEIAEQATGTLQSQADTYAEGWEAARDRVKASAEGIYQSLINDNAIIKMTNGLASALEGVEGLVNGLGGMNGVLSLIGSIFMTRFAKEIPQAIQDITANINVFTGKATSDMQKLQSENIALLESFKGLSSSNSLSYDTQIEGLTKVARMTHSLTVAQNEMSESEKALYRQKIENVQATYEMVEALAQEAQALREKADAEEKSILNASTQAIMNTYEQYANAQERVKELTEQVDNNPGNTQLANSLQKATEKAESLKKALIDIETTLGLTDKQVDQLRGKTSDSTPMKNFKLLQEAIKGTQTELNRATTQYTKLTTMFDKMSSQVSAWEQNKQEISESAEKTAELKTGMQDYIQLLEETKKNDANFQIDDSKLQELKSLLNDSSTSVNDLIQKFEELRASTASGNSDYLRQLDEDIIQAENDIVSFGGVAPATMEKFRDTTAEATTAEDNFATGAKNAGRSAEELAGHATKLSEVIGQLSSALMSINAMINSLSRISDVFNDKDASAIEKFGAVIGVVTTAIMAYKSISTLAAKATLYFAGTQGTAATATAATGVAATGAAGGVTALNAALSSGPVAIITIAIMALTAAFVGVSKAIENARQKIKDAAKDAQEMADAALENADATKKQADAYEEALSSYEETKKLFEEGKASADELKTAQEELNVVAKDLTTTFDIQGLSLAELSGDYRQLTEDIREATRAKLEDAQTSAEVAQAETGKAFVSDMREGTGHKTVGGGYAASFSSDYGDTISKYLTGNEQFISAMSDWESGLTSFSLNVDNIEDIDQMMAAYEEVRNFYRTVVADNHSLINNSIISSMGDWLEKSAESYEQYVHYAEEVKRLQLEIGTLDVLGEAETISSQEEYLDVQERLITLLAQKRELITEDQTAADLSTESYNALQTEVQKYLGTLSNTAPYVKVEEALATISTKTGKTREEIEEFRKELEKLGLIDFEFAANYGPGTTEEDWKIQAAHAQANAQLESINTQREAAQSGIDLLGEKGVTAQDIAAWAQSFDFDAFNEIMRTKLDWKQFISLTDEDRDALLTSYQRALDAQEMATMEAIANENEQVIAQYQSTVDQLKAIQATQEAELNAGKTDEDELHSIETWTQEMREYLDLKAKSSELTTEEEERLTSLAEKYAEYIEGAGSIEALEQQVTTYEELNGQIESYEHWIEQLDQEMQQYNDTVSLAILNAQNLGELWLMSDAAGNAEDYALGLAHLAQQYESCTDELRDFNRAMQHGSDAQKEAATSALETSVRSAELAEQYDMSAEEIETYAKQFKELMQYQDATSKALAELAKDQLRFDKAVESSIKNYDDWLDELKLGEKGALVSAKTLNELADTYSNLLDIDPSMFSQNFLRSTENIDLMRQALEGDEEAYQRLLALANEEIRARVGLDDEDYYNGIAALEAAAQNFYNCGFADIEAGASLDDSAFIAALEEMINATAMTVEEATSLLASMGVDAEIVSVPKTETKTSTYTTATPIQTGTVTFTSNNPVEGGTGVYDYPAIGWQFDQVPVQGETQEVAMGLKVTSANKSSGGNVKAGGSAPLRSNGGSATPKKSGGGGGGGGNKEIKHADKKSDSEKERYHTLKNQLEDLSAAYDRVSKAADRAFGKDKLKLIDGEIKATDDLIKKQEEYIDAIQKNLPTDKAIMETYAQKVLGFGIQYDQSGNISNYDALQDAMWSVYNARADAMDSSSTEWQVFEKEFEELQHWIEQYEETYDLLRDEEDKLQEYVDQQADLQLKKIQYAIELKLNVADDSLAVLNYQLDRLEDKAFSAAEAIALMGSKVDVLYDKVAADREGLDRILGQQLSQAEIKSVYEGDMSVLRNKHFTADQIDAIKEYRDDLLSLNEELLEIRQSVQDKVMETFDEFNEKIEDQIDLFDHYNAILENYKNIIDIVGRSYLKVDKELMKTLNQATINNAINKVKGTKDAYDALVVSQKEAEEALQKAIARGNEIDIAAWEEDLEEIQKKVNDAQENMMQAWEDALQSCAEMFELAVEDAIDNFNKAMLPFGSLEEFQDAYDKQKEVADQYLDDYDKIYELSKLARNVNNSINDAPNIAGKQKLAKLLEKINGYQEDGVQMSEYELEYLQKEYDLRLAEIALEEAQNAKSIVRLTRDNEGNYSYSYTADTSAVDDAAQKYEDALHAMQELSSNYIDEMSDQLIDATQQMEEELAAVRVQDYASIEDYYKKIDEIQQYWLERMGYMQGEFQKALDNNKALYDEDWQRYADATGYKISADEDFAKSYQDTVLGKLFDSEDDIIDFQERVNDALGDSDKGLIGELLAAYIQWQENTENAMEAAGTSSEGFAEHMEEAVSGPGGIVDQSDAATDSVENMTTQMIAGFTSVIGAVDQWQNHYSATMDSIIAKNMDVIEAHNLLVRALSTGDSTTATSGSQSTTGGSGGSGSGSGIGSGTTTPSSGSSGGVSGQSGSNGGSDLSVGSYVDVKSGTKWYADSWGGAPWGWARSGTIQYTADGNPLAYNIEGLGWIRKSDIVGYDTGGYTGEWGPAGRLAMLHEKEVVLNADDSANILAAVDMVRDLSRYIDIQAAWQSNGLGSLIASVVKDNDQTLQQEVSISANFPNVQDRNEIEQAFNSLINTAAQYANRKNPLSGLV